MVTVRVRNLLPIFIFIGGSIAAYVIFSLKRKKKNIETSQNDSKSSNTEEKEQVDLVQAPSEKKILVLGLSGAGKSTLLQRLSKSDSMTQKMPPTEGFNVVCVHTDSSASLNYWEIGGGSEVRGYWDKFLQGTCLLAFLVDSSDQVSLSDAAVELHKVATNSALKGIPILVVASKQDVAGSVSVEAMDVILDLQSLRSQDHTVKVVPLQMPPSDPFHPSTKDVENHIARLCGLESKNS